MDYEAGTNVSVRTARVVIVGTAIVVGTEEKRRTRVFYGLRPIPYTTVFVLIETNAVSAVSEK